jgi:hypothetical protein
MHFCGLGLAWIWQVWRNSLVAAIISPLFTMLYFFHRCIHKHRIYSLFFTIQVFFSLYKVNFKFTNWHWKNINGQFIIYVIKLDVLLLQIIFLWPLKYTSAEIVKVFITDLLMTKKDAGIHSIKYSIKYRYLNWLKLSSKFRKVVEHFNWIYVSNIITIIWSI